MNTNNARSIVNSELLEVDKPSNLVNDDTLNLGGLDSYGTAGQIIKVNSSADGLVYGAETDTQYSGGKNITIDGSNHNINLDSSISIDRLTMNYGGSGDGNEIRFKNDEYHYIKYITDGLRLAGYGTDGPVVQIYSTFSDSILADFYNDYNQFNKDIWLKDNTLYFYVDPNNNRDDNHYIKYASRAGLLGIYINGIQIGGYGEGNTACFEVVHTQI